MSNVSKSKEELLAELDWIGESGSKFVPDPPVAETNEVADENVSNKVDPLQQLENLAQEPLNTGSSTADTNSLSSTSNSNWFSGIISSAVKHAELGVKELQKHSKPDTITRHIKENVQVIRDLRQDFTQRAIPAVSELLQTIAPNPQSQSTASGTSNSPAANREILPLHIILPHYTMFEDAKRELTPMIHQLFSYIITSHQRLTQVDTTLDRKTIQVKDTSPKVSEPCTTTTLTRAADQHIPSMGDAVNLAVRKAREFLFTNTDYPYIILSFQLALLNNEYTFDDLKQLETPSHLHITNLDCHADSTSQSLAFYVHLIDTSTNISMSCLSQSFPRAWFDWQITPTSDSSAHYNLWSTQYMSDVIRLLVATIAQRYIVHRNMV